MHHLFGSLDDAILLYRQTLKVCFKKIQVACNKFRFDLEEQFILLYEDLVENNQQGNPSKYATNKNWTKATFSFNTYYLTRIGQIFPSTMIINGISFDQVKAFSINTC